MSCKMRLFFEFFLHLNLGCDTSMICTRCSQNRFSCHSMISTKSILNSHKKCMTNMKYSSYIGWWYRNYKWFCKVSCLRPMKHIILWFEISSERGLMIELFFSTRIKFFRKRHQTSIHKNKISWSIIIISIVAT